MHKLPTFGEIRRERGSCIVDSLIPVEEANKLGWKRRKRHYLKTKDMEEALARLEDVKAKYNQTYLDALNEYDPLVAKAQQLLELLVQKYVEGAKINEMQLVERDRWFWSDIPIRFNDLTKLRHRTTQEQIETYNRLIRVLRMETLNVLEYVNKNNQSIRYVGDFAQRVTEFYEKYEYDKNKDKDKERDKAFTEIREQVEALAQDLEGAIESEVTPYYHEWGLFNQVLQMKRKMQDEGNTMPDAELEKMIMFSLGVSEHNAQRYKDIERVFNEFYDRHKDKEQGRKTEDVTIRDVQRKWKEHELKLDGNKALRKKSVRQYELGQEDFIQRNGNIKLSELNTRRSANNFIKYLDEEYHNQPQKKALSNQTIKTKKAGVSVLIDFAVERDEYDIDTNAWKGVAVANKKGTAPQETMAWTEEMLKELFSMDMPENYKLIFRIAYITGCRLEEASALLWSDIAPHNGINCISLMREDLAVKGNRNSSKTSASRRIIPIVPILQNYLDEHAKRFKKPLENNPLAGTWVKDKDGKISGDVSKKLGRYRRKVKLPDNIFSYTLHSFRNTFLRLCEKRQIDPEIAQSNVGHVQQGMRRNYKYEPYWGDKERLQYVLDEMSKIDFSISKGE